VSQSDRLPVRRSRFDDTSARRRRHRFHDELDDFDDELGDRGPAAARRRSPDPLPPDDGPATGDRWSTWDIAQHGPEPHPDWLVTEFAAVDIELGVLKTGKEADVHLVQRAVPGTFRSCQLAAKR
jgi:RIO kinase 1